MLGLPSHAQRGADTLSFVTPYWCGREFMRIHLSSIRSFYPTAPILVSKRGGEYEEMETHRAEFAVQYWLEDYDYADALLRLLERCETEYVCIIEHDTVLLSTLDNMLAGLATGRWDLVGMEERVRDSPATSRAAPSINGWWRFAPGQAAGPLLIFNWREFKRRWGLAGVRGRRGYGAWEYEYDHGISQKLTRHKYVLPFYTDKYGIGTLLKDGDTPVLWHQWYGAYRTRLAGPTTDRDVFGGDELVALEALVRRGEATFLAGYPTLDFSVLVPAWGPEWDIGAEQEAAELARPGVLTRAWARLRWWRSLGLRGLAARAWLKVDRWRRMCRRSADDGRVLSRIRGLGFRQGQSETQSRCWRRPSSIDPR
jgi:hypothetical protein